MQRGKQCTRSYGLGLKAIESGRFSFSGPRISTAGHVCMYICVCVYTFIYNTYTCVYVHIPTHLQACTCPAFYWKQQPSDTRIFPHSNITKQRAIRRAPVILQPPVACDASNITCWVSVRIFTFQGISSMPISRVKAF